MLARSALAVWSAVSIWATVNAFELSTLAHARAASELADIMAAIGGLNALAAITAGRLAVAPTRPRS